MNSSIRPETSILTGMEASATHIPHRPVLGAVKAAWGQVCRWSERRRQRIHLDQLDAHLLKGIGVTRKQARREANRWFFD